MGSDVPPDKRTLFRASVILGCTALIIGVAGVFYFGAKDRRSQARLAQDVSFVTVQGPRTPAGLVVTARWETANGVAHEEAGVIADDPWTWTFEKAPAGVPLTLRVYRQGARGRRELSRQPAIFTRGGFFEVIIAADDAEKPAAD